MGAWRVQTEMQLQVNGQVRTLADGLTVAQLLEQLNVQPERVVVEVNLTILKRAQHRDTVLKDGDQVEIVHFVGGGALVHRPQPTDHRRRARGFIVGCFSSVVAGLMSHVSCLRSTHDA